MLSKDHLVSMFAKLDAHIEQPQTLCLIGASAFIMLGMPGRQTEDVDVWRPASQAIDSVLERAAKIQGISYNPTRNYFLDTTYTTPISGV